MNKQTALIGIGMGGDGGSMTCEAREYIASADILIGARRMLEVARPIAKAHAEFYPEYRAQEIMDILKDQTRDKRAAILLSGDLGFYSGARKLSEKLTGEVLFFPGISSAVYFAAKIHSSWEDMKLLSAHGKHANLIGEIRRNPKVFALLGTSDGIASLARKLEYYEMSEVTLYSGENLGYPEEKIKSGPPKDFLRYEASPLSVVCIFNPHPVPRRAPGIPDEEFLRDKVPMTKEEVREVSVSKLSLTENSIVYDIGAGSGSVSIEMADLALEGRVYAIEKKALALDLLEQNKKKFAADNMEIISGTAPEALSELPPPTHAFIGGSSGRLADILKILLEKNPEVRLVINCITLETLSEALKALQTLPFTEAEIVSITVAKAKHIADYHMMIGQNPVYILSCTGSGEKL